MTRTLKTYKINTYKVIYKFKKREAQEWQEGEVRKETPKELSNRQLGLDIKDSLATREGLSASDFQVKIVSVERS